MPKPVVKRWAQRQLDRGEPYRWLKSFRCNCGGHRGCPFVHDKNGYFYVEQTATASSYLGIALVADARALVYNTSRDMMDAEGVIFPRGSTAITVMAQWTPLVRPDRVILTSPARYMPAQAMVERDSADLVDAVPVLNVQSISWVRQGTTVYTANTHFTFADGNITWLGATRPANGSDYVVGASYSPMYEYNLIGEKPTRPDIDQQRMPQRGGILTQVQPVTNQS